MRTTSNACSWLTGCIALGVLYWAGIATAHAARPPALPEWAELIDAAKNDPACADAIDTLVGEARAVVNKGLIRRAYRL